MEQKVEFKERFLGKRYSISFPFELYMKMKAWFQHFDNQHLESVVWGKVEKKNDSVFITDIIIPHQTISSAAVDINDDKNTEDESVLNCNLSIHSHHTMGVFFSSTDESNITKWIADIHDVFVYGVYSGDDYKIILYDPTYQYVYQPEVNIIYNADEFVKLNEEKAQKWVDKTPVKSYINDTDYINLHRPVDHSDRLYQHNLKQQELALGIESDDKIEDDNYTYILYNEACNIIKRKHFTTLLNTDITEDLLKELTEVYEETQGLRDDWEIIDIFKCLIKNLREAILGQEATGAIEASLNLVYEYVYV